MAKTLIDDLYEEEIKTALEKRNELPSYNWHIYVESFFRKARKFSQALKPKKRKIKNSQPGKIHWMESEFYK